MKIVGALLALLEIERYGSLSASLDQGALSWSVDHISPSSVSKQ